MMKNDTRGESAARLARNIACVKYTLFCFNIVAWVSLASIHREGFTGFYYNLQRAVIKKLSE